MTTQFTTLYLLAGFLFIPLIFWSIYTQVKVKKLFEAYSKVPLKKGISGSRVARNMLNDADVKDVVIEEIGSNLGDHYDPRHKVIRLSRSVARESSVASVGIAAHEASHAIQDSKGYPPVRMRNTMAPIVEKASFLIIPLFILGLIMGRALLSPIFTNLAIFLFFGIVIFYLVTLPVELEASAKAVRYIQEKKIADDEELKGIRAVLKAAAFTYVIAAILAIIQLIRLLGMSRSR